VSRRYIGVDPGLVTGIAVYEVGKRFNSYELTRGQIMGFLRQIVREDDVVVVERYTISAQTIKKTRQNDAMQVTGAVQELCREKKASFILQEPAPAKRIGSSVILKTLKWYRITKDNHANDAASLVLMGLLKTNHTEYARLLNL
jgi:hypothetical protein